MSILSLFDYEYETYLEQNQAWAWMTRTLNSRSTVDHYTAVIGKAEQCDASSLERYDIYRGNVTMGMPLS